MKLRCDVCDESDAAVFCSADEAALCLDCDGHIHLANKLASRHQRFSLVPPFDEDGPPCDTCRERRAFMFCQQERAILCGECDLSVHAGNKHAKQHDRFVLTGLMLSKCSQTYEEFGAVPDFNSKAVPEGIVLDQSKSNATSSTSPSSSVGAAAESADTTVVLVQASSSDGHGLACGSSLSEYLMETLPGWQVDELLESCPASSGTFEDGDGSVDPLDRGIDTLDWGGASGHGLGFWVPRADAPSPGLYPTKYVEESLPNPSRETNAVMGTRNHHHKRWSNDGFTVPHLSPSACKRNRTTTLQDSMS